MTRERIVVLRPRTVISVAFVLLGLAVAIWIVWVSIRVLTWVFVAVFLALALDPAVRFLQAHGMRRRGAAAAVIYTSAVAVLGLLAALLLPPLIDQAEGLADAAPDYVEDITAGRGPLGFLQRDYQLVDRIREATENREGSPLGSAGTLLEFGRGRGHDDRRHRDHRLPHPVHDPRGPEVDRARPRPHAAAAAAALAQRRPADRRNRVRLRDRQPRAVADRRDQQHDRPADHGRSRSRSHSG